MKKIPALQIEFGPTDPLNPQLGYYFKVSSKKGTEMHTHVHPDTGYALTPWDCIFLAQTFYGPDPEEFAGLERMGPDPGGERRGIPFALDGCTSDCAPVCTCERTPDAR